MIIYNSRELCTCGIHHGYTVIRSLLNPMWQTRTSPPYKKVRGN